MSAPSGFRGSLAVVIGVDNYGNGVPKLQTPVADAEKLAELLRTRHGFVAEVLIDTDATLAGLRDLLERLPARIEAEDRLLFYFAGHGIAVEGEDGPRGYLLPHDADRRSTERYLPMVELDEALSKLPCRHMLVILDCCFAGSFRWSSTRDLALDPVNLHQERYSWLIRDHAWQAIASAAHDQKAIDVVAGEPLGKRGDGREHSPFARALLRGLDGSADRANSSGARDGVITATELFLYLQDELLPPPLRQAPVIWPMRKHRRGEFLFLVPGEDLDLPPAPPLNPEANPWRGLKPYEVAQADLFFGRSRVIDNLVDRVMGISALEGETRSPPQRLVVVSGPSGIGKSSLIRAGLLPRLPPTIEPILFRPGPAPFTSLVSALQTGNGKGAHIKQEDFQTNRNALAEWVNAQGDERDILLVVDQAEELLTQNRDRETTTRFLESIAVALAEVPQRLSVIFTVRSEFEPLFAQSALGPRWTDARFVVPPMTHEELRQVIQMPAAAKVLRFESDELVNQLADEVVNAPGALPLLSFALSEMYNHYLARGSGDRTISREDYDALEGGVPGALRIRANHLIESDNGILFPVARRLLQRFVSVESGEFTRRRVPRWEFDVNDPQEASRIYRLLESLVEHRLLVSEAQEHELQPGATAPSDRPQGRLELAHDALIFGWDRLLDWVRTDARLIVDLRQLTQAADEWRRAKNPSTLWLDRIRRDRTRRVRVAYGESLARTEMDFIEASRTRLWVILALRAVLVSAACIAIAFGIQLFIQAAERRQTIALLAAGQNVEATIDTPRQYEALVSAVEAAHLSETHFGRILPEVRSSLLKSLGAAREVWRLTEPGPQITAMRIEKGSANVLLVYRRDADDVGVEPRLGATVNLDSGERTEITGDRKAGEDVSICSTGACIGYIVDAEHVVLDTSGRAIWRGAASEVPVGWVDFDPATRILYYATRSATLVQFNVDTGRVIREQPLPITSDVWGLAFDIHGGAIAFLAENSATLFSMAKGTSATIPLTLGTGMALNVNFAAKYIIFGTPEQTIEAAWFESGERRVLGRLTASTVDAIATTSDGKTYAYTENGSTKIRLANVGTGPGFSGIMNGGYGSRLLFTPDNRYLLEAGWLDNQIKKFDLTENVFGARFLDFGFDISRVSLCPDALSVAVGGFDGSIVLVDQNQRTTVLSDGNGEAIDGLACRSDLSVVSLSAGAVRLWRSSGPPREIGGAESPYGAFAVLPGDTGVIASSGKTLWKLPWMGDPQRLCEVGDVPIRIAIHPSTHEMLLGSMGAGHVELRGGNCQPILPTFRAHEGAVFAVTFTAWNDWLASAGTIGTRNLQTVSLWDRGGAQMASRDAHSTIAMSLSFDRFSSTLLSAGSDGAIRMWNSDLVQIGPDLLHFDGMAAAVTTRPDGMIIAAGGKRLAFLDISDTALIATACTRLVRRQTWNSSEAVAIHERVAKACAAK
ncbi:MAG: caspase family protein [Rhizobiaceae bacterium]